MAFGFAPIVHIVAAVFSIIELGLTAYWASLYHWGYTNYSPSSVNFMVFNSVWSLLVLAYIGLVPLYMTSVFHRLAALALNVITAIFWFAGAIAVAVGFGGPYDCRGNTGCQVAEAAIAFGFFLWAIFTFLAVVDAIESLRRRGHHVETKQQTNAYPGA
ncbi:membrane-associating domain-containing protein [Xylaria bambusicola]|uniref:membrane-associating domain-containing protein n=1 Tax=Xylaria bambusicola TaxID=326684 RepID=UPI00200788A3|nr:membrane-associating domain-containing protein [Xylaria bambusicola]KAI0506684.1 membrane-associating domain-containing protein [Xylaria bambusicola]